MNTVGHIYLSLFLLEDLVVRMEKSKTTVGCVLRRRLAEQVDVTIWLSKLHYAGGAARSSLTGFPPKQKRDRLVR